MKAALVIMAAGIGARYGGSKQVDGIGPNGEILMEYSIHDALRAGFTKVVFIIKPEMEEMMRSLVGERLSRQTTADGTPVDVRYVFQDFTSIPDFYTIPEGRTKPFGTVHALLCAEGAVEEPFCVINADDFYGAEAYRAMYEELCRLPKAKFATMVAYLLRQTASLHGTVTRGVCWVKNRKLTGIREAFKIQMYPDGRLVDLEKGEPFPQDTVVSMNFWGFAPTIFATLRTYFENFLRTDAGDSLKSECLLPILVGHELEQGELTVSVLQSEERWFGMTYQEDKAIVAEELKKLHDAGVYPPSLRG